MKLFDIFRFPLPKDKDGLNFTANWEQAPGSEYMTNTRHYALDRPVHGTRLVFERLDDCKITEHSAWSTLDYNALKARSSINCLYVRIRSHNIESNIFDHRQASCVPLTPILANTPCNQLPFDHFPIIEGALTPFWDHWELSGIRIRTPQDARTLVTTETQGIPLYEYISQKENVDLGTMLANLATMSWVEGTLVTHNTDYLLKACEVYPRPHNTKLGESIANPYNFIPRRLWDLVSNRVVDIDVFAVRDRNGEIISPRMPASGYWAISHSWTSVMQGWLTPVNNFRWPVPLPVGVTLEDIRWEALRAGAVYCWLDVLCLRQRMEECSYYLKNIENEEVFEDTHQKHCSKTRHETRRLEPEARATSPSQLEPDGDKARAGPSSQHIEVNKNQRLEEWALDVPTIGNNYRQATHVIRYFNGLGIRLRLSGWGDHRHWINRAWTLQESRPEHIMVNAAIPAEMHFPLQAMVDIGGERRPMQQVLGSLVRLIEDGEAEYVPHISMLQRTIPPWHIHTGTPNTVNFLTYACYLLIFIFMFLCFYIYTCSSSRKLVRIFIQLLVGESVMSDPVFSLRMETLDLIMEIMQHSFMFPITFVVTFVTVLTVIDNGVWVQLGQKLNLARSLVSSWSYIISCSVLTLGTLQEILQREPYLATVIILSIISFFAFCGFLVLKMWRQLMHRWKQNSAKSMRRFCSILALAHEMSKRKASNERDKIAGLAYLMKCSSLPTYAENQPLEDAWLRLVSHLPYPAQLELLFNFPKPRAQGVEVYGTWIPTWEQVTSLVPGAGLELQRPSWPPKEFIVQGGGGAPRSLVSLSHGKTYDEASQALLVPCCGRVLMCTIRLIPQGPVDPQFGFDSRGLKLGTYEVTIIAFRNNFVHHFYCPHNESLPIGEHDGSRYLLISHGYDNEAGPLSWVVGRPLYPLISTKSFWTFYNFYGEGKRAKLSQDLRRITIDAFGLNEYQATRTLVVEKVGVLVTDDMRPLTVPDIDNKIHSVSNVPVVFL